MADAADDDDERWSDWEEEEGDREELRTQSLFEPSRTFASPDECLSNARDEFGLDILKVTAGRGFYERIQLVNYVRSRIASGEGATSLVASVLAHANSTDAPPWRAEDHLKPVVEGDPLLFSLGSAADESDDESDTEGADGRPSGAAAKAPHGAARESLSAARAADEAVIRAGGVVASDADLAVGSAEATGGASGASSADGGVEAMRAQMAAMHALLHDMASDEVVPADCSDADEHSESDGGSDGGEHAAGGGGRAGADARGSQPRRLSGGRRRGRRSRPTTGERVDKGYFESYDGLGIHHTMLSDKVRTEAYRDAIQQPWMRGKRVLDIGCGTSILSLFAAAAGAAQVFAVDASEIIDHAREVVRRNGMDDRIALIRGKAEEVALPTPKVDVIISEWMGYFLLYEAMLPSVLEARDKWLASGGVLLPNRASLQLRLSEHSELAFWDSVYGFDMANIGAASKLDVEADVMVVPAESSLSAQQTFHQLDLEKCVDADLDFSAPFELRVTRDGELRSFIGSFETAFDLSAVGGQSLILKTGVDDLPTHWQQTVFHLRASERAPVAAGETVRGVIGVARQGGGRRDLDVSIQWSVMSAGGDIRIKERAQLWKV